MLFEKCKHFIFYEFKGIFQNRTGIDMLSFMNQECRDTECTDRFLKPFVIVFIVIIYEPVN